MSGRVTDSQRKKLEAALIAALTVLYGSSAQKALRKLGVSTDAPLSQAAQDKIAQFASDRAALIQSGVDSEMAGLDDGATPQEVRSGIDEHNSEFLIPWLALQAGNWGTADAYDQTPSDNPDLSMKDALLWNWIQRSDYEDSCAEAADASPAPYDELVAIAGGEPQIHDGCMCSLEPAD